MKALPSITATLLVLTGCGPDAESFDNVGALAGAVGCGGVEVKDEPQISTDSGFTCEVDGREVSFVWFADDDQQTGWEDIGTQVTDAMDSSWLRLMGEHWAALPGDGSRTALVNVQHLIGGEIKK